MDIEVLEKNFQGILCDMNSEKIVCNSEDIRGACALGYFSKVLENSHAIVILLKERNTNSVIHVLLRNMLEAVIDLANLVEVHGYVEYLVYQHVKSKIQLSNKTYFQKVAAGTNYLNMLEELERQEKDLKKTLLEKYGMKYFKSNRNPSNKNLTVNLSIKFKFELSKSLDIYDSLYWILCEDTHNSISSLEHNYMELLDGDISGIKAFKVIPDEEVLRVVETTNSLLSDAYSRLKKILGIV